MSSIARPPDPCLVAIILIVRSRAGPRFVFHYPPNPTASTPKRSSSPSGRRGSRPKSTGTKNSELSDQDAASSSDDEEPQPPHHTSSAASRAGSGTGERNWSRSAFSPQPGSSGSSIRKRSGEGTGTDAESSATSVTAVGAGESASVSVSRERLGERLGENSHGHSKGTGGESSQPSWDTFLGLKTDVWEKLLCPTRSWHKRRFEVGVNDLAFVGWPVFAKSNGTWKKTRRKDEKRQAAKEGTKDAESGANDGEHQHETGSGNLGDNAAAHSRKTEKDRDSPGSENDKEEMTMFNVVFVLNPSILEYHVRVKEKYDNVIKKFGKGLKAEQSRAGYVWDEVQKILHIKEKARENGLPLSALYSELLSKSSLAQAVSTLYSSISNSRIASVTLTPETSMSLQIPPLTSTSSLPSMGVPSYPGLWLTTADSLSATDEASGMAPSGPSKVLAKHFALLLLADEATILKDIENSMGSLGQPLAHYIRCSKPNKSFEQISAQSGIPLNDIQVLANHLVYWRRARAIPPLNQRDTYIVSPNADMSKLGPAAAAYEAAFPTLPSLPKMLRALSGTPRPYSSFIPSKDHKQLYFEILAWMMRGGWVTQLRTFGWIKADLEIKRAVAETMAQEEEESSEGVGGDSHDAANDDRKDENIDDGSSSSSSSLDSEASGDATPMPGRHTLSHRRQSLSRSDHDLPTTASLILHPYRATPLESRWLEEILARFPEPQQSQQQLIHQGSFESTGEVSTIDNSLERFWPQFMKYFNGTDALEKISVREGLKRKLVWRLLSRIDISGGPQGARGGMASQGSRADANPREKVLVTARHW